ncbi:hypothetical protein ACFVXC_19430 [Streptomyces sp. NPDC058257]|uniref:hypothetical protein n=1 Tax=Streptomyces sp. NPDC058257 TaxID=3346409 RepID=UPI0036EAE674
MSPDRSEAAYAGSAADLALRALDALRGIEGTATIAEHVETAHDPQAALAAIRILGADTFAPYLLAEAVFHPQDAAAVTQSFEVFPPPLSTPAPPPAGTVEPWLVAWRDWATTTLLARFTGAGTALPDVAGHGADGGLDPGTALVRRPTGAPELTEPEPPVATGATDRPGVPWQIWSVRMGQLSPLALPGLDGPVHDAARAAPLVLARGATRAVLRRDFSTAARITRWLALLAAEGARLPLDPVPLVEHIGLHGGGSRLALDVAISRRLLALEGL